MASYPAHGVYLSRKLAAPQKEDLYTLHPISSLGCTMNQLFVQTLNPPCPSFFHLPKTQKTHFLKLFY